MIVHPSSYISLRYSCTNLTAIAPSPTAEATRLIESDRTSPAANMPGRLVSSRNGCLGELQCGDCARTAPVRINPLLSLSISAGNQSVRGTAPMKVNIAGVFTLHAQPAVVDTGRDQEALGGDGFFAVQMHYAIGFVERQTCDRRGNCYAGTELVGLENGAVRQLASRHTGGKAQIVFDAHAGARLPARCCALEHRRP